MQELNMCELEPHINIITQKSG